MSLLMYIYFIQFIKLKAIVILVKNYSYNSLKHMINRITIVDYILPLYILRTLTTPLTYPKNQFAL